MFSQLVDSNTIASVGKYWHISEELHADTNSEARWSSEPPYVVFLLWPSGIQLVHLDISSCCVWTEWPILHPLTVLVPSTTGLLRFRLSLGQTISVIQATRVQLPIAPLLIPMTLCGMGKGVAPAALAASWTGHCCFVCSWTRLQEKIWSWGFAVTGTDSKRMFWFRILKCMYYHALLIVFVALCQHSVVLFCKLLSIWPSNFDLMVSTLWSAKSPPYLRDQPLTDKQTNRQTDRQTDRLL